MRTGEPGCAKRRLMAEEDELKAQRIRKRDALLEMGIDPYGGRFPNVTALTDVRRQAEPLGLGPGERSDLSARVEDPQSYP